jgi:inner membrane protein
MTGKTHQIIGITLGLGVYLSLTQPVYSPATLGAVLVFSSIGALLPDIDNAAADIWHTVPFLGHTAGKIVDPFLEHRNITHSLVGTAIIGLVLFLIFKHFPSYWGINTFAVLICTMVGYLSHLLADSFTVQGIPLLWPAKWKFGIPPKPFEGVRIMTGKWFENLIIFPAANLALILLILARWSTIKLILFK